MRLFRESPGLNGLGVKQNEILPRPKIVDIEKARLDTPIGPFFVVVSSAYGRYENGFCGAPW